MIQRSPIFEPRKHRHGIQYHATERGIFPPQEWVGALLSLTGVKTVEQQRAVIGGVILATAAQTGTPLEGRAHRRSTVTLCDEVAVQARYQHFDDISETPLLRSLQIMSFASATVSVGYPSARPGRDVNPYAIVDSHIPGHVPHGIVYDGEHELTHELVQAGWMARVGIGLVLHAHSPSYDIPTRVAEA